MLCNPPQPEDADIQEELDAFAAVDAAPSVDASVLAGATGADESAGAELPETGDSEESAPFRVKRSRPLGAEDLDARVVLFRCLHRPLSRLLLLQSAKGPGLGGCCVLAMRVAGKNMVDFCRGCFPLLFCLMVFIL